MPALGCWRRSEGRTSVLQAHVGVWMCVCMERVRRAVWRVRANMVRRSGRRRERGSMVVVVLGWGYSRWSGGGFEGGVSSMVELCAKNARAYLGCGFHTSMHWLPSANIFALCFYLGSVSECSW